MTKDELSSLTEALNGNTDFHWNLVTEGDNPTDLMCFHSRYPIFNINFSIPDIMKITFVRLEWDITRHFYNDIVSADLAFQCQILMLSFSEGFVQGVD